LIATPSLAKAYFEQVPLEIVKKIANQENQNAGLSVEDSSSQVGHYKYPEWQRLVQEALLEFDSRCLQERVAAAEAKIFRRLPYQDARTASLNGKPLMMLFSSLRVLQRDILKFPKKCA
jgi:hypothetical protein